MNRTYECVLILDPGLSDTEVEAQLEKVEQLVKAHAGKITARDNWGKRPLTYLINGKDSGNYVLLIMEGDNAMVVELERALRLEEPVLRYLTVKKDKFAPDRVIHPREERDSKPARSFNRDDAGRASTR